MTAQDYKAPESVARLQQRALFVGLVGLVLCIIGYVKSPETFLHSYLLAFIFVLGLSLGSLAGLTTPATSPFCRFLPTHSRTPVATTKKSSTTAGSRANTCAGVGQLIWY